MSTTKKITRDDMFVPLLAACPSFAAQWQEFLDEWEKQVGELPLYLALAELAAHICALIRSGDERSLDRIFDVIELWQVDGDDYVKLACTVGLLERVRCAKGPKDPVTFKKFRARLKPASKKAWNSI